MDRFLDCIEQFINLQVSGVVVGIVMLIVIIALAAWLFFRGTETT